MSSGILLSLLVLEDTPGRRRSTSYDVCLFLLRSGEYGCSTMPQREHKSPKINAPLLLPSVTTQAGFVFDKGPVRVSFPFKRPDHHDLLSFDLGAVFAFPFIMLDYFASGNCFSNTLVE